MKKIYIILTVVALALCSCVNLNLKPTSDPSSDNWYQNADQIILSLNDLYRTYLYNIENEYWTDRRTDDWAQRVQVYEMTNGSATSSTSFFSTNWLNTYKGISRAIRVIESIEKLGDPADLKVYKAEACFFRAYLYGRLTVCWGDAPFYINSITYQEAYKMGRTDKNIIKEQVYKDYDYAIENLPVSNNGGGVTRIDRCAALALKGRYALMMGEYKICAESCKELIDLDVKKLYYSTENPADSYGEYFRDKTYNCETIFAIGRSYSLAPDQTENIKSWVLRTAGGNAVAQPSWDLLAAYECTDGKIITDSPLFDPKDPYKNRDPRCNMTFAAPSSIVFGVVFQPHPDSLTVYDEVSGKKVKNQDTKSNDANCAYNGCCIRKGVQPEWKTGLYNENPVVICRYADVLLMYAEAKIELGEIDNSVLNAINKVRARAYGVSLDETTKYPAITTTDQAALRKIVRRERRVELSWEGIRFFDLRRWGLLKKCYSSHYYGLLNKTGLETYAANGHWFWPRTPEIDEDGFADFSPWFNEGLIELYGFHMYDPKVELFPIPDTEIIINPNLVQNPGY